MMIGIIDRVISFNKAMLTRVRSSLKERPLLLIFLLSLVSIGFLLLTCFNQPVSIYDEGDTLLGALRVYKGELPYIDFWTLYPPGQYYVLAFLFKLCGISVFVERIYDIVVRSFISLLMFSISVKLTSKANSFYVWSIALLWLGCFIPYGYTTYPAILFLFVSIWSLINYMQSFRVKSWTVLAGVSIGLASMFRLDFGFSSCLVESIWLFAYSFLSSSDHQDRRMRIPISVPFIFLASAVLAVLLPFFLFILKVPLSEIVDDVLIAPVTTVAKFRSFPYPSLIPDMSPIGKFSVFYFFLLLLGRIKFYFPIFVLMLGILRIITSFSKRVLDKSLWMIVLLICEGLTFIPYVLRRGDIVHLPPLLLFAIMLVFPLVELHPKKSRFDRGLNLILIASFVPVILQPVYICSRNVYQAISSYSCPSNGLVRGRFVSLDPDQVKAIKFIQSKVPRDGFIYVGTSRHDRIEMNDIIFYFLSGRNCPTKYHDLLPGIATTAGVQSEIIGCLNQKHVMYIVLYSGFENLLEPNASSIGSGVHLLDDFIRLNYGQIKRYGYYSIWQKF